MIFVLARAANKLIKEGDVCIVTHKLTLIKTCININISDQCHGLVEKWAELKVASRVSIMS